MTTLLFHISKGQEASALGTGTVYLCQKAGLFTMTYSDFRVWCCGCVYKYSIGALIYNSDMPLSCHQHVGRRERPLRIRIIPLLVKLLFPEQFPTFSRKYIRLGTAEFL